MILNTPYLNSCINILEMNAESDAHQQILRALNRFPIDLQQIRSFQRLESEIGVVIVATIVNRTINALFVGHNDVQNFLADHRRVLFRQRVMKIVEHLDDVAEPHLIKLLVQVRDGNARCQNRVVRMFCGHAGRGFGRQIIQFRSSYTLV